MKNLILLFVSIIFFSCEKELPPPVEDPIPPVETISVFGDWLLVDGKMYMENLETGEKTVYEHFDDTKTVSSLRYEGQMFEFERIVVDSTVWSFISPNHIPNMGEFWLNYDSLNPYGFNLTTSNMSIVEWSTGPTQLGGSSRPLSAYLSDYSDNSVNFYVQETYESIGGVNYKYFSELTFVKQ